MPFLQVNTRYDNFFLQEKNKPNKDDERTREKKFKKNTLIPRKLSRIFHSSQ
jgi:hypothetical protein